MSMLKVKDLKVNYGGIEALKGISFDVEQGQIVTLIGANGAGKSTTLRAISGLVKTASGAINFLGRDIIPFNAQQVVAEGIALVPEGRRVFDNLTVKENLKIGAYLRSDKEEIEAGIEDIYQRFPRRAMMARPKLLMMDEPSLGLAPLVVKDIFSIIRDLKSEGITILLIEQNANAALRCADQAYVLETGRITMSGTGEALLADQRVRDAYLGSTAR